MLTLIVSALIVVSLIAIGIGYKSSRARFRLYFDIESPTQLSIKFKKDGVRGIIHINRVSDCYTPILKTTPNGVRVELPLNASFESFQHLVNYHNRIYSVGVKQLSGLAVLKSIFGEGSSATFENPRFETKLDMLITNYFKDLPDIHFQQLSYVR